MTVFDLVPLMLVLGLALVVPAYFPPESPKLRRAAFWLLWALQVRYLVWRLSSTIPAPEWSLSVAYPYLLMAVELLSAYAGFKFTSKLTSTINRSGEADEHERWYGATPPRVAILIPTYNESVHILERTLVGATGQDHSNTHVYVCDDGRRAEVRRFCEQMGVGYFGRPDNLHAKAGNINHALKCLFAGPDAPDFIAVLDADFIPRPQFVRRTLALMHAEDVGIVQTPQYHYNSDPLQSTYRVWKGWPDQQRSSFNLTLPSFDAQGAAYCCGTSFLARAKALEAIGGLPTESVTEDVLTTIKMGGKGYRTVFLRELLTTGLAPEGLDEYLTQRGRWSLGGVQIGWWLLSQKGPGATLLDKILTFEGFVRWGYMSLLRVIWMLVPLIFWFTGAFFMQCTAAELFWYLFPVMALDRAILAWVSRGTVLPFVFNTHQMLTAIAVIPGTLKGVFDRRSHKFKVTDKGRKAESRSIHWHTVKFLGPYAALLVAGIFYRCVIRDGRFDGTQPPQELIYVALFWSTLTLIIVMISLGVAHEMPLRRSAERYETLERARVKVEGRTITAGVRNISVTGATLVVEPDVPLAAIDEVFLDEVGWIDVRAVRKTADGGVGIAFVVNDELRRALIKKIYCSADYVHPADEGHAGRSMVAVLKRAFG